MAKIYRLSYIPTDVRMIFYCPGCECEHAYRIQEADKPQGQGPIWSWNGSYDAPTFSPSLLNTQPNHPEGIRCHLFVNDGVIDFCSDSSHKLAGTKVAMTDIVDYRVEWKKDA